MADFLYTLDPSSKKFICPDCGEKRFVRFISTETREYHENEDYGRCDREDSCQYYCYPRYKPNHNSIFFQSIRVKKHRKVSVPESILFIPYEVFAKTRRCYERNNLVQFLFTVANPAIITNRIILYNIGTACTWEGATIFWQIDQHGNIRTGKMMLFYPPGHEKQGKRVKEPKPYISFIHSRFKSDKGRFKQCLFGEHLLGLFPLHPVALVESEKTALICSIYYSDFIWLATGGKQGFTEEKCAVLKNRKVEVFPDLGSYEDWLKKIKKYSSTAHFQISDFMELNATDEDKRKDPGMDLADFLVRYPSTDFHPEILIPDINEECRDGYDAL